MASIPSHRQHAAWALRQGITHIVAVSKLPIFVTLTFSENLVEKKEAAIRWRRLKERLRRRFPGMMGAGAWQRQVRGAWHYHGVWSRFIDVTWLRSAAVECGFGPQMRLEVVVNKLTKGQQRGGRCGLRSLASVSSYISRYVARDFLDESIEPGVRVVDYFGSSRVASTAFTWADGFARLWRLGCDAFFTLHGQRPRWRDYGAVVDMGWHCMSEEEQAKALAGSDVVFKWRCPELVPF